MVGSRWCRIGAVLFVQQDGRSDVLSVSPPVDSPADCLVSVGSVVQSVLRLCDGEVTGRLPIYAYGMKVDGLTSSRVCESFRSR